MVVEDHRKAVRQLPERQQGPVICPGAAVHQQERMAASDDVDEQFNVSNGDLRHSRPSFTSGVACGDTPSVRSSSSAPVTKASRSGYASRSATTATLNCPAYDSAPTPR